MQKELNRSFGDASHTTKSENANNLYFEQLQDKREITAKILSSISSKLHPDSLNNELADIVCEYYRLASIFEPDKQDCQRLLEILQLAEFDSSLNHLIAIIDVFLACDLEGNDCFKGFP